MNRLSLVGISIILVVNFGCSPKTAPEPLAPSENWKQNGTTVYWKDADTLLLKLTCKDRIFPTSYRLLEANNDGLKKLLVKQGIEPGELSVDTISILIPVPDGTWEPYKISQVRVMSKELAAKYPDIKTYSGKSELYPTDNIRLDVSQQGVRVMIRSTRGTLMIDPYCTYDQKYVISYSRKNLPKNSKEDFER